MSGLTMIDSLPNEILDAVLDSLPTPSLLPMALVCRRFRTAVTETVRLRLLRTADLDGHEMEVECYHPIAKLTTPTLSCHPGSVLTIGSAASKGPSPWDECWGLGNVEQVYSRFVPDDAWATQEVALDEGELFSQLCASVAMVRSGPRRGLYRSHSGVGDGVVRVWRDWLATRATAAAAAAAASAETETNGSSEEDGILWADYRKNLGVRFGVTRGGEHAPPARAGDEPAVEYTLHYRGMFLLAGTVFRGWPVWRRCKVERASEDGADMLSVEVLVRTSRVLLAMERSAALEGAQRGKAVVITSSY
ncbi:F-box domain-containing protein [Plectosphaerella cucumerina]|uniref:F-box domain-containing protein n=1 Tax=Plectosphaerella cucumerina TaxID=40658 RepID=A0A8K0X0I5_9PEZI|nr:F-box domain-containing protein [Plectosphaerella cucumerina]